MIPNHINLAMLQGTTVGITFSIVDSESSPIGLQQFDDITMKIGNVFELSIGNGLSVSDNVLSLHIPAADMNVPSKSYSYRTDFYKPNWKDCWIDGKYNVLAPEGNNQQSSNEFTVTIPLAEHYRDF